MLPGVNPPTALREVISPVDAAWLRMDRETNPLTITSVLHFDEPVDAARLEAVVRERLLAYPRFVQRVDEGRLVSHWEPDPHFDLRNHFHRAALPSPGGRAALGELVSDLMSTPLDRSRPLWQLHCVEGYEGGSAVVMRLHHAIADGVALVGVMLSLTDEGTGLAVPSVGAPPPPPVGAVGMVKRIGAEAATAGRLILLPSDPASALRGALGSRKIAAWSGPIDLATIKAIARRASAKVNDVLMAAVSAALLGYLEERGGVPAGADLRALVPVYLQGGRGDAGLGNHFGLVFFDLPLHVPDALERVREARRRMDAIKSQPDAIVSLGVLMAIGVATPELEHLGIDLFTRKASVMVTNVPATSSRVHIAGKLLCSAVVWAPVSGSIGLGVSLLSYGGEVRLGVSSDAGVIPDPEAIVRAFERDVDAMRAASLAGAGGVDPERSW